MLLSQLLFEAQLSESVPIRFDAESPMRYRCEEEAQ